MIASNSPIRAALVSVGGAAAPVLFTLQKNHPAHVWYFCSAGSRTVAEEVHAQLDWHPDRDFVEVGQFEELGPCYRELRQAIPTLLRKWRIQPAEVLVDYTGGTKTMSAALVLAATEVFEHFSYIGGEQREKGGLGVTVDGKERLFYEGNPWSELAIREVERARDLWVGCQFDAAARVLREVAPKVPKRLRFEAVANAADAMAARHRLDFHGAIRLLGRATKELPALLDGCDDARLLDFANAALAICSACEKGKANTDLLRELLDNTLRTASQHRYEDAAARLYRAMEMQGQIWLAEATNDVFVNGKCKAENTDKLPEPIRALDFCKPGEDGRIELSLEKAFKALSAMGDKRGQVIATDIALKGESRWRRATEKRNSSILAHGVASIREEGLENMKQLAAEFLGFDLGKETNPIPALNPRWLDAK